MTRVLRFPAPKRTHHMTLGRTAWSAILLPLILTIFVGAPVNFVGTPVNTATAEEASSADAQWIVLFDGSSTDAWREYGKDGITTGWRFDGDMMTVIPANEIDDPKLSKKRENLITKEMFDAFELELEFRVTPAANSGVMYHVVETKGPPYKTGPEIQIQDNVNGHDPQKCGWLYQLYKADTDATKPVGQWNRLRIVIHPDGCLHEMNGVMYVQYVKSSDDWNNRVANSKFSKWSEFGTAKSGHICLQDHGDEVSYRNIRIRRLQ